MECIMTRWAFADIPDQTGRTALVTGANTGIGFETARMLARKGARVVLACRNREKGESALERIRHEAPAADVSLLTLDLADLDSVSACARSFMEGHDRLDLLIDNAGVMVPPLSRTKQGFELQFGTNHLGHFALTGRLLPLVAKTPGSRVVVVSSTGALIGRIHFEDLHYQRRRYRPWPAYGQSKLANLMFTSELARRLEASGSPVRVTAAHPGGSATDLQRNTWFFRTVVNRWLASKPSDGALPTLRAAVDPEAASGSYWGPGGAFGMRGPPVEVRIPERAKEEGVARRLWEVSEELTGVRFPFGQESR
jgi:NAD(P)-dependent dehydrogenase (short-subunit alcohol dehydrogenase family)